ncbi:MFS transporter [Allostreptomyces psammosilenae]|uniref:MFS family permease n=1 Tax=Allostreptomyces psammosilenae TaxID=1892865 RepID=A0A852ZVK4_9ACTN|nr:MFS transporter [Allostreptomyces psammosilenae]NYI04814.1 MFS family permease [Allostreptomyces psammosilenae]
MSRARGSSGGSGGSDGAEGPKGPKAPDDRVGGDGALGVAAAPWPGARRARAAITVVFALHGAVTGSFATRIPWLQDHLSLSAGQLGLALVAPALGASLAMPLASRVTHRHGGRAAVRGLLMLWCAALALPALSPGLPWLFLALLLYGASAGMADVAMNAGGVAVEERLGRSVMSSLHGMWSVGGLLASGVGVAAASAGLDARVHLAGVAALLVAAAWWVGGRVLDVRPPAEEAAPPRFALPPRSALLIGAVGFCAVFAEGASMDWCAVYLTELAGASPGVAAACYTGFACAMAATRLAGDAVVGRFGAVRTVRASGLVAAVGGVLVVLARTPPLGIVGFALLGVGIAVVVPVAFAAAGRSGPVPSQAIAGVATVTYTSGLVAPAAVGALADATSLTVSFALVTVLAALLVPGARALRSAERARTVAAAPTGPTG